MTVTIGYESQTCEQVKCSQTKTIEICDNVLEET